MNSVVFSLAVAMSPKIFGDRKYAFWLCPRNRGHNRS